MAHARPNRVETAATPAKAMKRAKAIAYFLGLPDPEFTRTYGFTWGEFNFYLGVFMPILFVSLGAAELAGLLWRPLAIVIYAGYLWPYSILYTLKQVRLARIDQTAVEAPFFLTAGVNNLILVVVSGAELLRLLSTYFGGFTVAQLGYWHWLRLGVSAMLDNVLFNASEIYGWTVTDISPNTLWSRVAMIAFNLYLELLAISAVIRFLEVSRSSRRRLPRRHYSTYLAFMLPRIGSTLVTLLWALPIVVALVAIWHDGFDLGFTWSFLSSTVPFVAGIWLVATHMWALSVRGIFNRLAALTGVVAGAALVVLAVQPYLMVL